MDEYLKYDALLEAEKITGKSYKDDEKTSWLGLDLHVRNEEAKRHLLRKQNDTYHSMPVQKYLDVITQNEFKIQHSEEFVSPYNKKPETFYMYYRKPGQLLFFDTYKNTVNGGRVYYNWIPDDYSNCLSYISSGGCIIKNNNNDKWSNEEWELAKQNKQIVWYGDYDCREALIYKLKKLKDNGCFVEPWIHTPYLWLLTYKDTGMEGCNYEEINQQRLEKLPNQTYFSLFGKDK